MASDARALLDQLMGSSRNDAGGPNGPSRPSVDAYTPGNCPYYTVWGRDPYELFSNTRSSIGANPLPCSDEARRHFLSLPPDRQKSHPGNVKLLFFLKDLVTKNNRHISQNKQKVREESLDLARRLGSDPVTSFQPGQAEGLVSLCLEYDELASSLLSPPPSEEADGASWCLDALTNLRDVLRRAAALHGQSLHVPNLHISDKVVCSTSGNFMCAKDADDRIAAHYAGKQYEG
eukprot:CAMPEP_0182477176 /NCGR_PEP_ID=MMETSP1319-20130603/30465_1 /TAXON_ID=172717 /ORGANISM="Bolidomonas pacifica, Strain RCC208" /LENGTH=232 /DNA_ID=CAMNT_0024678357 /DNA_START=110 /DNA_END=806 /DNA_ORIENTATION=+